MTDHTMKSSGSNTMALNASPPEMPGACRRSRTANTRIEAYANAHTPMKGIGGMGWDDVE